MYCNSGLKRCFMPRFSHSYIFAPLEMKVVIIVQDPVNADVLQSFEHENFDSLIDFGNG